MRDIDKQNRIQSPHPLFSYPLSFFPTPPTGQAPLPTRAKGGREDGEGGNKGKHKKKEKSVRGRGNHYPPRECFIILTAKTRWRLVVQSGGDGINSVGTIAGADVGAGVEAGI